VKRRAFCTGGVAALAAGALPLRNAIGNAGGGDTPAIDLHGQQVTVKARDIAYLRRNLHGEVITADQAEYDAVRQLWNGAFDRKPALVVRCASASDVRRAVSFAADRGLLTAVRSGGHSFAGQSSCDGGLVVDLRPMHDVHVDPISRRARVGSGAHIRQVDRATQASGLATPLGDSPDTGIAGLTLGGGLGWLRRRHGLTADNVTEAELVTADGSLLRVSSNENPDLYWALRGGGGNFGVVTSFSYRLHEVPAILIGGTISFPMRDARRLLRSYAEICANAPDDLSLGANLNVDDTGVRVVEFAVCYSGSLADGERAIALLRSLGKPLKDELGATTYLKLQGNMDPSPVTRRGAYVRGGLAYELTPTFIDSAVDYVEANSSIDFDIELFNLGGAISRVAPQGTAYWARGAAHALLLWGQWTIPGNGATRNTEWVRSAWKIFEPHTRGYYANFCNPDDDEARVRAGYGDNYARLTEIKRRFDPMNLFRLNANIRPA
jgi:FAD/FMN-containing dehydrogenase